MSGLTPRTADAHVVVDDVAQLSSRTRLADDDRHHLTRVLRLEPGDSVTLSDGRGRWRAYRLERDGELASVGDVTVDPAPSNPVTIAFALVKGDRPELVVQKLTEIGVDRIVPFTAARSVVRWDEAKVERQAQRFARIAREAAMQCRRTHLPEVLPATDFATVAALPGACCADALGGRPSVRTLTVLIGPEGGWSDEERAVGLPSVCLGPHVLRSETAAITAGALLVAMRGDVVHEV